MEADERGLLLQQQEWQKRTFEELTSVLRRQQESVKTLNSQSHSLTIELQAKVNSDMNS